MKQLKKSLSLLLALLMLVGSMTFTVNAAAYPDIEDSKYEQAINLVSALGIMTGYEDGTFAPDQPLTRAEYCMVLCRMLGMDDVLESTTYVFFEDVLEEHWAAKAISMIFSLGYANGYGDGNFGPEHSVLYQDAVKMTVNALGYGFMAEREGGYPNGYISVASQNGLLKNISCAGDEPITRGALAQLVYNALTLELLEEVYSDEGMSYQKGDETLLSRTFKAVKAEGQVTANGAANIAGNNPVRNDEVRIDGVLYKVGNTNAADYLGYNVLFYYTTNDDGEYVLLMCEVKSATNKTVVLDADDVEDHTSAIASGSITYINEKGNKNVTAKLSANPSVLYNGKKVSAVTSTGASNPDYSLNVLLPTNGTITLVDNDGDSTYDVLDIKAIETYIVNGIDKNKKFVYLKADAEKGKTETAIDFSKADEKEYNFTLLKDGEPVEFKSLAEWDILSIMKSLDGTSYTIYVSSDIVTGYISKVAQAANGGFGAVTIEDVEYEVVDDYYSDDIETGLTGTFYLDYTGKIAAYNSDASGSARYVYLMAVDNQSTRLTTDVSIKICTTAGSFATYALNEKVYFTGYYNGVWVTDKKIETTDLYSGALTTDGKVNDQLIIIETDDQNKITEIQMACDIKTAGDDYDEKLFSQDLDGTRRYGINNSTGFNLPRSRDTVGQEAVLPNSSPIFIVTRVNGENSIAENRIAIKYRRDESIFNDTNPNMDIKAYDVSSGGNIPVAVMYSAQKAAAIGSYRVESGVKLMMVNEVVQTLNEDGDPVTAIVGLANGQATEVIPSSNKLVAASPGNATLHYSNYLTYRAIADGNYEPDAWQLLSYLQPGDIFWYDTNADGFMEIYQPLLGRLEYAKNEDGSIDTTKLVQYDPRGNVAMPDPTIANNNSTVGYKGGYDHYAESLEIFGTAYDKDPATNTFKYKAIWGGEEFINANYCGGFVCVYDVETETFKTGSLADMVTEKQAGDYANKVLVHTEYSYPDWVLIYQ